MSDLFVSYSRKDVEFVRTLHDALSSAGKDIWVDLEDIPPAAKWRPEISAAIDAADSFVFVISPDSVASGECGRELAHAVEQHKRLIGVVHREADPQTVPETLSELNFIFCRPTDDFDAAARALIAAADTDLEWVKAHTRLLTRAVEWESQDRNGSLLLQGSDLEGAEAWMALSGTKKPPPTELQGRFVLASRRDATTRQRRRFMIALCVLVVVAILAALAVWQYLVAQKREEVALGAFYRLIYDVRETLKGVPGTNSVRQRFIEGNIAGLNQLVEVAPDDQASRELATNYRALAEVFWKANGLDKAADAFRRSNEITERLVGSTPSESLYWRDLAVGHVNLGLIAAQQAAPAEALREFTQALPLAEHAARLDPRWSSMVADVKSRIADLREGSTAPSDRGAQAGR